MSAENTVEEKQSRRRRRRQAQEVEDKVAPAAETDVEADEDEAVDEAEGRGVTQGKGRATPGRRTRKEVEEEGNAVVRSVGGVREYIQDTLTEINKVTWPTWEDARRLTFIVLVTIIIAAIVMGTINVLFTELFRVGLSSPSILIGFFVLGLAIAAVFYYFVNRRRSSVN